MRTKKFFFICTPSTKRIITLLALHLNSSNEQVLLMAMQQFVTYWNICSRACNHELYAFPCDPLGIFANVYPIREMASGTDDEAGVQCRIPMRLANRMKKIPLPLPQAMSEAIRLLAGLNISENVARKLLATFSKNH